MTLNNKVKAIAASLALLAFAVMLFMPVFTEGKIIAPLDIATRMLPPWNDPARVAKAHNHYAADAVTQYLPYRIFFEKSLREDGYIGWNPYEMGGYSLAANTMALPGSWAAQLHRFLAFKDAWNTGIIAEFLIAGSGMLLFLRNRRQLPWLPCLIGSIAYMANSQFIIWIYHRWALGSFCWMPWVLWAVPDSFHQKGLPARTLFLPLFLALAILGGSLQHLAFVVLACACLFAGGLNHPWRPARMIRPAAFWTIAFALAFGITIFTLVPQIQGYFQNINMGCVRGTIGYESGPLQPLSQAILIPAQTWPWLFGDPQTLDANRLFKCGFMDIAYMGTIPMVLAIAGLFHRSMPRQAKWLIAAGLLIPLTPLVGPLYHRVQLLFLLGGAWMAAEMIAILPLSAPRRLQRCLAVLVGVIGVILLAGTLLPTSVRGEIEAKVIEKAMANSSGSSFKPGTEWIEQRARAWTDRFSITHQRTALLYGLLVMGSAGFLISSNKRKTLSTCGHWMIFGATSLELFIFAGIWNSFSDPEVLVKPNESLETVRSLASGNRVLQRSPDAGFTEIFATPNTLAARFVKSVDSYESIQYPSGLAALQKWPAEMRLTLTGVGIAVYPTGTRPPEGTLTWPVCRTTGNFDIRQNPDVPAPVTAGTGPVPTSPDAIAAALKTALPIKTELETMNRRTFAVPPGVSWIRISQNWHAGWKWRTPDGDWHDFTRGPDSACWIDHAPVAESPMEIRFFPIAPWINWFSQGVLAAWICLMPILIRCGCFRRDSQCGDSKTALSAIPLPCPSMDA